MTVDERRAHNKSTIIAILLTCIAYGYFNIGDAAIKVLSQKFHISQIMFINSVMVIAFMVTYGAIIEGRKAFRVFNPKWMALRATFALGVAAANLSALPHVRLTTFYTLIFTSPFWIAILSAIFLGERLEKKRFAVIIFGFFVILYILRPGGAVFNIWAFLVLLSAFMYSCSMVIMRHMGSRESRVMIICSGSLFSALASAPFLPAHYVAPTLFDWGLFGMISLIGAIGVMCIAYAFQNAPSVSVIAPFHYTQMIWGALLGYYLFGEIPDMPTMIGAGLLILGGLYLIYLETRSARGDVSPARAAGWFSRLRAYNPTPK